METGEILSNPTAVLGKRIRLSGWIYSSFDDHNFIFMDTADRFETSVMHRPTGWLELDPEVLDVVRRMRCGCGGRPDMTRLEGFVSDVYAFPGKRDTSVITLMEVTEIQIDTFRYGCSATYHSRGVAFEDVAFEAPVNRVAEFFKYRDVSLNPDDVRLEGFLLEHDGRFCLVEQDDQWESTSLFGKLRHYLQEKLHIMQSRIGQHAVLIKSVREIDSLLKVSRPPDGETPLIPVQVFGRLYKSSEKPFAIGIDAQKLVMKLSENSLKVYDLTASFPGLEDCG